MAIETSVRIRRHSFTVDDYYRMADAGILGEDDRVELIKGEIVEMTPIGSLHAGVVDEISMLLTECLTRSKARVRVQNPIRLDDESEPQPDIVVAIPRPGGYRRVHPSPKDVLLLVEVSEGSLPYDRFVKLPLYARAGIPEVWIVDLEAGAVEVYRQPQGETYALQHVIARGSSVSPQAFGDIGLAVDVILGQATV